MTTEDLSPRYLDFDLWDNKAALQALYEGQLAAVAAQCQRRHKPGRRIRTPQCRPKNGPRNKL